MHDSVEEADVVELVRTRVAGLKEHVRPTGEAEEERLTVPLNPFMAATETVEDVETPALTGAAGVAETLKS